MTEEQTTWDLGDEDRPPPEDVIGLTDYTAPDNEQDGYTWGRVTAPDPRSGLAVWKGYKNGGKVYLDWWELLRRWGPVTVSQRTMTKAELDALQEQVDAQLARDAENYPHASPSEERNP